MHDRIFLHGTQAHVHSPVPATVHARDPTLHARDLACRALSWFFPVWPLHMKITNSLPRSLSTQA